MCCMYLVHTDFREKFEEARFDLVGRVDMLFVVRRLAPRLEPLEVRLAKLAHMVWCSVRAYGLDGYREIVRRRGRRVEAAMQKTREEENIDSTVAAILLLLEAVDFHGYWRGVSSTTAWRLDELENAGVYGVGSGAIAVAERVEVEANP